jgi:hypothetical protein
VRRTRSACSVRLASIVAFILAVVLAGGSNPASARIVADSPNLPPEPNPPDCETVTSHYVGIDVHALFPSGIVFSNPRHFCFQNVEVFPDPGTGDEYEFFESTVEGTFDDGSGPQVVVLTGPVQVVVRGKGAQATGSWQTEILSMDLSGDVGGIPIQIRESPVQPSMGQTTVANHGNGQYRIDSFFDSSPRSVVPGA